MLSAFLLRFFSPYSKELNESVNRHKETKVEERNLQGKPLKEKRDTHNINCIRAGSSSSSMSKLDVNPE